jgi:hypothetical protein
MATRPRPPDPPLVPPRLPVLLRLLLLLPPAAEGLCPLELPHTMEMPQAVIIRRLLCGRYVWRCVSCAGFM